METKEARNLAAIERLSAGFARHDVDAILDCFTDDGIFDITEGPDPWGERFQGKVAVRAALETLFKTLPDVQFTEAVNWVAGDRGTSEWTCVGTTPKSIMGPIRTFSLPQRRAYMPLITDCRRLPSMAAPTTYVWPLNVKARPMTRVRSQSVLAYSKPNLFLPSSER